MRTWHMQTVADDEAPVMINWRMCGANPTRLSNRGKMLKSNADLKERLTGWTDWDLAAFHLGACLGFWPDMGAPPGEDHWHGVKGVMWSSNPLGNALYNFLDELVTAGMLEKQIESDIQYRWNPNYKEIDR